MGDIIQLLPDHIANQIAAGEVIQRPASVVKELVENAVDAGATHIALHIKDAGRTSIQVIDNGKGMSEMDARMCFERHATSKLQTADDLFQLRTKGFRGEALASIAAIAHVELFTKMSDKDVGTHVEIHGSKLIQQEPKAGVTGTSITVKNLFFNVPARRNFLKSDQVETKHIIEEFHRIVLVHPEISFLLTHNQSPIHDLKATSLRKRIVDLFGMSFNTKLVPLQEDTDIVKVSGFILKPEYAKKQRGEQYFFVNNRFFKDSYLHHAVSKAFENLIPPKTYPSYFIYLDVDPKAIDVNIHPTKTEIKFEEERNIYAILRSAVKLALGSHQITPTLDFEQENAFTLSIADQKRPIVAPEIKVNPNYNPFDVEKERKTSGGSNNNKNMQPNRLEWENYYEILEQTSPNNAQELYIDEQDKPSTQNYLQVHQRYLLTPIKSGVLLVDIRRAKERLLYDELMDIFLHQPITSQQLLFPLSYPLQPSDKLLWNKYEQAIQRIGFQWEWNNNELVFSGLPAQLQTEELDVCLSLILEQIHNEQIDVGEIAHVLIAAVAKASAKQFKQKLSNEECVHLMEQLFSVNEHQYCPSGNKIMTTIELSTLIEKL
jgi:DNA mismatch repair protein MutL